MRFFYYILAVVLVVLAGIYLNRAYAYFFHTIGQKHLADPNTHIVYTLDNKTAPANPLVYTALGDSLTAGVGSSKIEQTFPYLIAQKLNKKYRTVTFFDFGVPGAKTEAVATDQFQKLPNLYPEVVTVLVGINDVLGDRTTEQFTKDYQKLLDQLNTLKNSRVYILSIPYLGSSQITFFPYNLLLDWRIRQFNQVIKTLVKRYPFEYIDLYALSKADEHSLNFYSADGFHPSDAGYAQWGAAINASIDN